MFKLSDYAYHLPETLIAQNPAVPRDSCRLMILDKESGLIRHDVFRNIGRYLTGSELLVLNNTKVMPARVFGKKESGGKVELLLLHEVEENVWECLVRPGRRLPTGTRILVGENGTAALAATIVDRKENGSRLVKFAGAADLRGVLSRVGRVPFPPYVTKATCNPEEYQTVYAKEEGSVAAPTAGLHFTDALMVDLSARGIGFSEITLHVGWGTFRPVRSENITGHEMEREWYSVPGEAATAVNRARAEGRRLIAVGTTACRVLESVPEGPLSPQTGWTNLFIYPGFTFKRVSGLITNFHLPRSTLLMLVSAFAGREKILAAYEEAVKMRYRFYSFGDAMLIL